MKIKAVAVSVLALFGVPVCASAYSYGLMSILNEPLKNDGRVLDMTIYPYDIGAPTSYYICWDPCSAETARKSAAAITPRMPGEFDGMHGDRPVRVRVRFNAYCFKPNAFCTELGFFFDELGEEKTK